jgi:hypothetical protein
MRIGIVAMLLETCVEVPLRTLSSSAASNALTGLASRVFNDHLKYLPVGVPLAGYRHATNQIVKELSVSL